MILTVEDISDILELEVEQIQLWCRAGILPALKVGGIYQIGEDEFADWQSSDAVMALLADLNNVEEEPEMESLDEVDL